MRICQPQLQGGQESSVWAVRLAGTRGLLRGDPLAASLFLRPRPIPLFLLVLRTLLGPAFVLGQEDVEVFPATGNSPAVR